jgi:hypothetical protein
MTKRKKTKRAAEPTSEKAATAGRVEPKPPAKVADVMALDNEVETQIEQLVGWDSRYDSQRNRVQKLEDELAIERARLEALAAPLRKIEALLGSAEMERLRSVDADDRFIAAATARLKLKHESWTGRGKRTPARPWKELAKTGASDAAIVTNLRHLERSHGNGSCHLTSQRGDSHEYVLAHYHAGRPNVEVVKPAADVIAAVRRVYGIGEPAAKSPAAKSKPAKPATKKSKPAKPKPVSRAKPKRTPSRKGGAGATTRGAMAGAASTTKTSASSAPLRETKRKGEGGRGKGEGGRLLDMRVHAALRRLGARQTVSRVAAEIGISEVAARAALDRLFRNGLAAKDDKRYSACGDFPGSIDFFIEPLDRGHDEPAGGDVDGALDLRDDEPAVTPSRKGGATAGGAGAAAGGGTATATQPAVDRRTLVKPNPRRRIATRRVRKAK